MTNKQSAKDKTESLVTRFQDHYESYKHSDYYETLAHRDFIDPFFMAGPMRSEVEPELLLHADQELGHALLSVNRIIQLGGTPVINLPQWTKLARCANDESSDPYIEVILEKNLKDERCAIQRHQEIADFTNGEDHSTHQRAIQILNE